MRELSASPSASRTVATGTIRTGTFRSRTIRRITAHCWKSFSPNTATSGWVICNSFSTTVQTPRKCPGRAAPQSTADTSVSSTSVEFPFGYIASAVG